MEDDRCPECGAPGITQAGCLSRYHRFLALEFADPAYGAVHHLTVLAYHLQHPSMISRTGWMHMRATLREFLAAGLSPQDVIHRDRSNWQSDIRKWSFRMGGRLEMPDGFRWGRSIDLVDESRADVYTRDITQWARHVLEDAEKVRV